jgi:hypothetical protein
MLCQILILIGITRKPLFEPHKINNSEFLTTIAHVGREWFNAALPREYSLLLMSRKDGELISALEAGADKTELDTLIRNGADVNAKRPKYSNFKDEVLVAFNVS